MKLMTMKEFGSKTAKALKSKEPLIIIKRGGVAGIFFPVPLETIPFDFKKDIFLALTESIKKSLKAKGIEEEEVLEDFERFRKTRRRR